MNVEMVLGLGGLYSRGMGLPRVRCVWSATSEPVPLLVGAPHVSFCAWANTGRRRPRSAGARLPATMLHRPACAPAVVRRRTRRRRCLLYTSDAADDLL